MLRTSEVLLSLTFSSLILHHRSEVFFFRGILTIGDVIWAFAVQLPVPFPFTVTPALLAPPGILFPFPLYGEDDSEAGDRGVEDRERELEILAGTLEIVERADRATERRELESVSRGVDVGPLERMRRLGNPENESVEP